MDAQNADAWNSRGLARQENGDLDGALADFNRAIALNSQQAAFYKNRGRARLAQGNLEAAEADFARCRQLGGSSKPEAERR